MAPKQKAAEAAFASGARYGWTTGACEALGQRFDAAGLHIYCDTTIATALPSAARRARMVALLVLYIWQPVRRSTGTALLWKRAPAARFTHLTRTTIDRGSQLLRFHRSDP